MKKTLKFILIILTIILILFIANVIRKFIIFNKISNNFSTLNFTNYYCKYYMDIDEIYLDESNPNYVPSIDAWGTFKQYNNSIINETPLGYIISIPDGNFSLNKENKVYTQNDETLEISTNDKLFKSYFFRWNENKTFSDKLELSLKSKIKTETFNQTKCYAITLNYKPENNKPINITIYIDKDTLLRIGEKIENSDSSINTYYFESEFNTLKEDDFSKEKLLDGYTNIKEN